MREKIETQADQHAGNRDQRDEPNDAVKQHREQCAKFFRRRFLEQEVALDDVAAGAAGQELIVKHSNKKKAGYARHAEMDLLHLEQNLPANGGGNFDKDVRENRRTRSTNSPPSAALHPFARASRDRERPSRATAIVTASCRR